MGASGIRHSKRLSDKTYLRSTLAISAREHAYRERSRLDETRPEMLFTLQVRNILGRQYLGKKYNLIGETIEIDFFTSPVPFLSYKLEF